MLVVREFAACHLQILTEDTSLLVIPGLMLSYAVFQRQISRSQDGVEFELQSSTRHLYESMLKATKCLISAVHAAVLKASYFTYQHLHVLRGEADATS